MNFIKKKSLGQNFLINQKIVENIVKIGEINSKDVIIEVGPGNGVLTKEILKKGPKDITVIEKDERLAHILNEKFKNEIKIINEDMMKVPYENYIKENSIIFGNLPYNISTQILAKWIKIEKLNKSCKKLILMFQKEVADRIIAKSNSKNFGRLSILSNWRMNVEKIIDIEPECFEPSPKVKSTLLTFVPKRKYFELKNPNNLEHVTNIFFNQRRKMIKNPMKFLFKNFNEVAKQLSINLNLRPQNLDCVTYYKICKIYENSIS